MAHIDPFSVGPVRPLRRAEYDRLVALGYFEDERIELLRGVLVCKEPQGSLHAQAVEAVVRALYPLVIAGRVRLRSQAPFAATDDSEPEPDVMLFRPDADVTAHPREALLIVEVAVSSAAKDRGLKSSIYATAGVPEYWIVDMNERRLEIRARPNGETFEEVRFALSGDSIGLRALPGAVVDVAAFL